MPAIGRAAGLPVERKRCDHFITLAALTPKVPATLRQFSQHPARESTGQVCHMGSI
jgi:hypothetical protein